MPRNWAMPIFLLLGVVILALSLASSPPYDSDAAKNKLPVVDAQVDSMGNVVASEEVRVLKKTKAKKNRKGSGEKPSTRRKRSTRDKKSDKRSSDDEDWRLDSLYTLCHRMTEFSDLQAGSLIASFAYKNDIESANKLLACGYALLLERKFDAAYDLVVGLLNYNPQLYQGYLVMGSYYSLNGRFQDALDVLGKLLALLPNDKYALRARAEIYYPMGEFEKAIDDWDIVLSVSTQYEERFMGLFSRGQCHVQVKRFGKAYEDFLAALLFDEPELRGYSPALYEVIGKCLEKLGRSIEALEFYGKAIALDPTNKSMLLNAASVYTTRSVPSTARQYIERALKIDSDYLPAFAARAVLNDLQGLPKAVLQDVERILSYSSSANDDPALVREMLNLGASAAFNLGLFQAAAKYFDTMLSMNPNDSAWFKREILFYYWSAIDRSVQTFNINKDVHPRVKEGFATSAPNHEEFMRDYPEYESLAETYSDLLKGEEARPTLPEKGLELLRLTSTIAGWIQVDSPGFMPHKRHYRMFGLAVLHAAQTLRRHVALLKSSGAATKATRVGGLSWQDFFGTIVKWRQVSAPTDPVIWSHDLSKGPDADRSGVTTWMIERGAENIRYRSYKGMAFNLTKELMLRDGFVLSSLQRGLVEDEGSIQRVLLASDVSELYGVAGQFLGVTVPCKSIAVPGRFLNGTIIKIDKSRGEGYDFGIVTLWAKGRRFQEFDEELQHSLEDLIAALASDGLEQGARSDAVSKAALRLFYYWVNLTPLTRGTAATGYAAILAGVLATGEKIDIPVPKGKQLDWEGILTADPKEFIDRIYPWIAARSRSEIPEEWLNGEPGYRVEEIFDTTRKMMAAINGE